MVKSIKNFFKGLVNAWHYYRANHAPAYSLKIVGSYTEQAPRMTIIEIKEYGYKNPFSISLQHLFNDCDLMQKLSPADIVRVTSVAICEKIYDTPESEREALLIKIKKEFLNHHG